MKPNCHSFPSLSFQDINDQPNEFQESKHGSFQMFVKIQNDPTNSTQKKEEQSILLQNQNSSQIDYQISFEDSFMEEHEFAFKNKTQNFIEQCFSLSAQQKYHMEFDEFVGCHPFFRCMDGQDIEISRCQQIEKKLDSTKDDEKLQQFYKLILNLLPNQFGLQIVQACFIVRKNYQQLDLSLLTQEELLNVARQIVEKNYKPIFQNHSFRYLNFRKVNDGKIRPINQIQMHFKCYIQFLFSTVLLLIEQYFANPFSQKQDFKRERPFSLQAQYEESQSQSSSTESFKVKIESISKKIH